MRPLHFALMLCLFAPVALAQQTGSFESDGLTLHYIVAGEGSPVVILSGGPGMDAGYMQPVMDIVAAHHTAILLHQRGTSGSMPAKVDETTITPALMLADMEALRTKLGYAKWTVMGHSAGSLTAMQYAIAHPERVEALVLLGAVPPVSKGLGRMMDNAKPRMTAEDVQKIGALEADKSLTADDRQSAENNVFFAIDFYDRANASKFIATQTPGTFHAKTAELLEKAMPTFDLTTGLATLHIPTLIVQGRQDPLDPEMAGEVRDAIPGAKLVVLERAGHFSWLENPADFMAAVDGFLSKR